MLQIAKQADMKLSHQYGKKKRCCENKAADESQRASGTHCNTFCPCVVVMFMRADRPGFEDVRRVLIHYHPLTSVNTMCAKSKSVTLFELNGSIELGAPALNDP